MASLLTLPNELLFYILEICVIEHPKSLATVIRINRRFQQMAEPLLYHSTVFKDPAFAETPKSFLKFAQHIILNPKLAGLIKSLSVGADWVDASLNKPKVGQKPRADNEPTTVVKPESDGEPEVNREKRTTTQPERRRSIFKFIFKKQKLKTPNDGPALTVEDKAKTELKPKMETKTENKTKRFFTEELDAKLEEQINYFFPKGPQRDKWDRLLRKEARLSAIIPFALAQIPGLRDLTLRSSMSALYLNFEELINLSIFDSVEAPVIPKARRLFSKLESVTIKGCYGIPMVGDKNFLAFLQLPSIKRFTAHRLEAPPIMEMSLRHSTFNITALLLESRSYLTSKEVDHLISACRSLEVFKYATRVRGLNPLDSTVLEHLKNALLKHKKSLRAISISVDPGAERLIPAGTVISLKEFESLETLEIDLQFLIDPWNLCRIFGPSTSGISSRRVVPDELETTLVYKLPPSLRKIRFVGAGVERDARPLNIALTGMLRMRELDFPYLRLIDVQPGDFTDRILYLFRLAEAWYLASMAGIDFLPCEDVWGFSEKGEGKKWPQRNPYRPSGLAEFRNASEHLYRSIVWDTSSLRKYKYLMGED